MVIRQIFLSPGHDFVGRFGEPPGFSPMLEVDGVECVAGRGLVGDRYFDHKPDYKGQATFFDWQTYEALWAAFPTALRDTSATRRNVVTEGIDLNSLIGQEFAVDGVAFRGSEECSPCSWMDRVVAEGAHAFLRGRGGLRARILTDGALRATPRHRVGAALLCGGKSSRMGRDKATLDWCGRPLWEHQMALLKRVGMEACYVSAPVQPEWYPGAGEWIQDVADAEGPIAGLAACFAAGKRDGLSHLLVLAVDLPDVSAGLIQSLKSSVSAGRGVVPRRTKGFEPLVAVYPVEALEPIQALIRERSWKLQHFASTLVDAGLANAWDVPEAHWPLFRNVNRVGE